MTRLAPCDVAVVVPVKNLIDAKQRLSPVLDPEERRRLFRLMLEDVLSALAGVAGLGRVLIVTRDPEAMALAGCFGAENLVEPANLGQTRAVSFAAQHLATSGASALLTVPADIPLVSPADLQTLLDTHRETPAVTIAPARDGRGSNAVLCSPPDAIEFRFGDDSFRPHLAGARARGIEPSVIERPGLGLDVDVPADLIELCRRPSPTRAYDYLTSSGIAARLSGIGPHAPRTGVPSR